jgi:hypothetical protein
MITGGYMTRIAAGSLQTNMELENGNADGLVGGHLGEALDAVANYWTGKTTRTTTCSFFWQSLKGDSIDLRHAST